MAKTLTIKEADFSTNKVTTVSFSGGSVPCTGISFEEDAFSFTDYTPVTIEYTLTPSNTTDTLSWATSNSNVATVSNGVITPVGLGTATITATCGNQTATATVTVALAYISSYTFGTVSSQGTAPNQFPGITDSQNRITACGTGAQAGTYTCYGKNGASDVNIIKLPKNTASVTVKNVTKSYVYNGNYTKIFFVKDQSCEATGFTDYALFISEETINFYNTQEQTFNVPEGADAMLFTVRTASSYTEGEDPADVIESMGFSLTFNDTAVS